MRKGHHGRTETAQRGLDRCWAHQNRCLGGNALDGQVVQARTGLQVVLVHACLHRCCNQAFYQLFQVAEACKAIAPWERQQPVLFAYRWLAGRGYSVKKPDEDR